MRLYIDRKIEHIKRSWFGYLLGIVICFGFPYLIEHKDEILPVKWLIHVETTEYRDICIGDTSIERLAEIKRREITKVRVVRELKWIVDGQEKNLGERYQVESEFVMEKLKGRFPSIPSSGFFDIEPISVPGEYMYETTYFLITKSGRMRPYPETFRGYFNVLDCEKES